MFCIGVRLSTKQRLTFEDFLVSKKDVEGQNDNWDIFEKTIANSEFTIFGTCERGDTCFRCVTLLVQIVRFGFCVILLVRIVTFGFYVTLLVQIVRFGFCMILLVHIVRFGFCVTLLFQIVRIWLPVLEQAGLDGCR